jgi:hypothetical protein
MPQGAVSEPLLSGCAVKPLASGPLRSALWLRCSHTAALSGSRIDGIAAMALNAIPCELAISPQRRTNPSPVLPVWPGLFDKAARPCLSLRCITIGNHQSPLRRRYLGSTPALLPKKVGLDKQLGSPR